MRALTADFSRVGFGRIRFPSFGWPYQVGLARVQRASDSVFRTYSSYSWSLRRVYSSFSNMSSRFFLSWLVSLAGSVMYWDGVLCLDRIVLRVTRCLLSLYGDSFDWVSTGLVVVVGVERVSETTADTETVFIDGLIF